jgi:predicted nucleic acid-binding protein
MNHGVICGDSACIPLRQQPSDFRNNFDSRAKRWRSFAGEMRLSYARRTETSPGLSNCWPACRLMSNPSTARMIIRRNAGDCKWNLAIYSKPTFAFTFGRIGRNEFCIASGSCVSVKWSSQSLHTENSSVCGATKSGQRTAALERLREPTHLLTPLPLPETAAEAYGRIRAQLEASGEKVGNNDLWIAAHALSSELTLVTNNEREFRRVQGLKLQKGLSSGSRLLRNTGVTIACWIAQVAETKAVGSRTCKPNSVCGIAPTGRPFLWAVHRCAALATYPKV